MGAKKNVPTELFPKLFYFIEKVDEIDVCNTSDTKILLKDPKMLPQRHQISKYLGLFI